MFCGSRVSKVNYYEDNNEKKDTERRNVYRGIDFDEGDLKNKRTAGLLGVFLGAFGVHRFYLGYTGLGIAQIIVSLLTCFIGGAIWGFVEGLCILCDTAITVDANGNELE